MNENKPSQISRPALTPVFLSIAAVFVALSTLLIPSVPFKIVALTSAIILLAATGASLGIVIARPRPSDS